MNSESRRPILIWSVAFAAALCLGSSWADWFEHNRIGPISSAGFIGWLLGLAVGAFVGVLLSTWRSKPFWRSIAFALAWAIDALLSAYVALIAGMVLAQICKTAFAFLGHQQVALMIGWSLGAGVGGLFAAAFGIAVHRLLLRSTERLA